MGHQIKRVLEFLECAKKFGLGEFAEVQWIPVLQFFGLPLKAWSLLSKEIDGEVNRPLAMPVVALLFNTRNHAGDDSYNLIDKPSQGRRFERFTGTPWSSKGQVYLPTVELRLVSILWPPVNRCEPGLPRFARISSTGFAEPNR